MTTPTPTNDTTAPRWTAVDNHIMKGTNVVAAVLGYDTAQRLAACADKLREFGELGECVVGRWVPCSERMPAKADGQVLGWASGCRVGLVWLSDLPPDAGACRDCPKSPHLHGALWTERGTGFLPGSFATHWMPLPALPAPSPAKG